MTATGLLHVRDLRGGYGDADILTGMDMDIEEGEIMMIAGPNGSGKSTLAKAVMGLLPRCTGVLRFRGEDLARRASEDRARLGIGYVPQVANVFPSLTVLENLQVVEGGGGDGRQRRIVAMFDLFPVLAARRRTRAGLLSGGERQQLALARALMTQPTLMILDEPTANLAPALIPDLFRRIAGLKALGTAVLLIEQRAREGLAIADRGCIMAGGCVATAGQASALLADADLARRFLGQVAS